MRKRSSERSGALSARAVILAAVPLLVTAAVAFAGPPWISIEYPPNRLDAESRGALALIHMYHHEHQGQFPVEGTAEGIVDGRRVSLPLKFTPVGTGGSWATWGQIPEEGNWVLVIHGTDGTTGVEVSLLAALAEGNQEISFVKVPRSREGNWPRAATGQDVESMLRTAVVVAEAQGSTSFRAITVGEAAMGLGGALLLLPFGLAAARRRRGEATT
ncbi:MAG: hypothetical protein Q8W45_08830 [Candidatus Palauibacterales bacterium]|nr:hypothetical protein [Candidatus Palauibacterales bacterium]MDP2483371.1 hypothetical protein [Candidatus Palauibacterales bacterium]